MFLQVTDGVEDGEHGGLVNQILETQKELQHGNKMKKPVEIVSIYHMIVLAASDLVISLVRA